MDNTVGKWPAYSCGERQMIHLLDRPLVVDIPAEASSCVGYIHWQDKLVPLVDLDTHFTGYMPNDSPELVGILTFEDTDTGTPEFGALVLPAIPARCQVDDSQACALPDELLEWKDISISCFSDNGIAIPILNINAF